MVLLWVLPGFASLSIVFSAGGEPVIKSDLLFRDLAPAPLRLAVQPVQPTAKSQASKPTDQPGAVESTTQMQSSKSAVQPEAPKKAVTTKLPLKRWLKKTRALRSLTVFKRKY
jgi:hypothetical protein